MALFLVSWETFAQRELAPEPKKAWQIAFANSGRAEAQGDFLAGLAALHSFWYAEAQRRFVIAREVDPGFALAYWGEAMSHYHALWGTTNVTAGRRALSELDRHATRHLTRSATGGELALIEAARRLFKDGEAAFSRSLDAARGQFPENAEIAVFYALSLQGLAAGQATNVIEAKRLVSESGALLERLFVRYPRHPGVLHYLIHAVDDSPDTARHGLAAARIYSELALESSHALHMPSHIFLQLGDWGGVVAANRKAWHASERWVSRSALPPSRLDFHALSWLHYGLLQQGRLAAAEEVLERFARIVEVLAHDDSDWRTRSARWKARHLIEAEDWGMELPDDTHQEVRFASIYAAARRGDLATARRGLPLFAGSIGKRKILSLQLEALVALLRGRREFAAAKAEEAVNLEQMTRSRSTPMRIGPPDGIKPALELQGEILLEIGECHDALRAFEDLLAIRPNRRLSTRGKQQAIACIRDPRRR